MMRLSGMATGMDIDQIVKDLMRAERVPLDKIIRNQSKLEWKMEDYREINLKLRSFSDSIFDNIMRSSVMKKRKVESSNSNLVTATASSNIGNTSFSISKVEKLATSATNASEGSIFGESAKRASSSSLSELNQSFEKTADWKEGGIRTERITLDSGSNTTKLKAEPVSGFTVDDVIVKVNGKTLEVVTGGVPEPTEGQVHVASDGTLTFADSVTAKTTVDVTYAAANAEKSFTYKEPAEGLNPKTSFSIGVKNVHGVQVKDSEGNVIDASRYEVTGATGLVTFKEGQEPTENITIEYKQNYTVAGVDTVNANGETVRARFLIADSQSLDSVIKGFNDSNAGVNMFYDDHSGQISVTRKETGIYNASGKEMTFIGSFMTDTLKINNNEEKGGTNAVFTVNGLETERRTNSFTISGMTVTLKDTFDQAVSLNASTDVDSVVDTITTFVKQYNELLDHVNKKLTEPRNREFEPLTDEERDALSDREIERWEEKARAGHLRNDPLLRGSFDQMRTGLYSPVTLGTDSEFSQLATIGITTSSDYMSRGKLEINEDKLRAAIEKDPDGVFDLFNADGETTAEKGLARRLRSSITTTVDSISQRAGGAGYAQNHQFTIGRELNDIEKRIQNFEMRLEQKEKRYWAQFNAMEAAVQRANNQGDMLMAQLYGNG